jgi:uncharacterized protein
MIPVEVINTFLVNAGKEFVILLRSTTDDRTLPISIGQLEAQSIAFQLNDIPFPRPLTHDLFKNVLLEIDGSILRTEICELKDDTFYARLYVKIGEQTLEIDARPSDAIAMALRFSSPIFVDETVMEEAGILISEAELKKENGEESGNEVMNDSSREPTTVELLRKQLTTAITEERYEQAARLRDEINKLTQSN